MSIVLAERQYEIAEEKLQSEAAILAAVVTRITFRLLNEVHDLG